MPKDSYLAQNQPFAGTIGIEFIHGKAAVPKNQLSRSDHWQ
jgi:hypothetical protein